MNFYKSYLTLVLPASIYLPLVELAFAGFITMAQADAIYTECRSLYDYESIEDIRVTECINERVDSLI